MRFSYVKYDEAAVNQQQILKEAFEQVEQLVNGLEDGRAKALVYRKLEEAYMWTGKSIRDSSAYTYDALLISYYRSAAPKLADALSEGIRGLEALKKNAIENGEVISAGFADDILEALDTIDRQRKGADNE